MKLIEINNFYINRKFLIKKIKENIFNSEFLSIIILIMNEKNI